MTIAPIVFEGPWATLDTCYIAGNGKYHHTLSIEQESSFSRFISEGSRCSQCLGHNEQVTLGEAGPGAWPSHSCSRGLCHMLGFRSHLELSAWRPGRGVQAKGILKIEGNQTSMLWGSTFQKGKEDSAMSPLYFPLFSIFVLFLLESHTHVNRRNQRHHVSRGDVGLESTMPWVS